MATDMRRLVESACGPLPARPERYRVFELVARAKSQAPELEPAAWALPLAHEADLTRWGVTPIARLADLARLPEWLTAHFGAIQGSPRRSNRLGPHCHDGHERA